MVGVVVVVIVVVVMGEISADPAGVVVAVILVAGIHIILVFKGTRRGNKNKTKKVHSGNEGKIARWVDLAAPQCRKQQVAA